MLRFIVFLVLSTALAVPDFDNPSPKIEVHERFRLPRNVRPISYAITLQPDLTPDLDPAPFNGTVKILVTPIENTRNITLKVRQLNIDYTTVSVEYNGTLLAIGSILIDEENEFYTIHVVDELTVDEVYTVTIGKYDGILHLDNGGFYLAKYMEDGVEKRFATTQFQSTNARRAFPSFDEPEWKATFKISMIRPADFGSVSNEVLLESIDLQNGFFEDVYRETVVMSTYLVAFVVSQLEYISEGNQRVFARPQAVNDGWCQYGLDTGIATIAALEDFLGIPYTLDKMDQVAIPDVFFSPGAMENWGLVIYKESALLYSETHSTAQQKQRIATVIAHEFGHQWFGNLVTCQWWRYTWLNEGFATYLEWYAASRVENTWRLMEQFVFDVHASLEFDSTNSTTPMNYETPYGSGAPGSITYEKAGSVIRMTEHFLTTEVFQDGLYNYLNARQFDVGIPEYLFDGFQQAVEDNDVHNLLGGFTVHDILEKWTDQEGHPVVTVTRDYETGNVMLKQERFLIKEYQDQNTDLLWPIPINFMFSTRDNNDYSSTIADHWFSIAEETLTESFPTDGYVIANKQQTGFYRVNYDITNWQLIINELKSDNFANIIPINRAQLIDDAFNLAKAGVLEYSYALDLGSYLERDSDYIPVNALLLEIESLRERLMFTEAEGLFNDYILSVLTNAANTLGFDEGLDDDHVTRLNRVAVMSKLCAVGDSTCRSSSSAALAQWKEDEASASPNLQLYVFCTALRVGNADDWTFLYERYVAEEVEFLRSRILTALGCSEDSDVINSYLDMILDPASPIIKTDRQNAFSHVYNSGKFGLVTAYEYLKSNFEKIRTSELNVNTIVNGICGRFNQRSRLDELKQLSETYGDQYFGAVIRTVEENIEWGEQFVPEIQGWLSSYVKGIKNYNK